jgi:hypothetical protein
MDDQQRQALRQQYAAPESLTGAPAEVQEYVARLEQGIADLAAVRMTLADSGYESLQAIGEILKTARLGEPSALLHIQSIARAALGMPTVRVEE